jgi:5-methylcytosine-specific restriction endonuclease McrA
MNEITEDLSLMALLEAELKAHPSNFRIHKYVGGPPTARLKRMQLAHETRARKAGVQWEMVDLRDVYRKHDGKCGICGEHVQLHRTSFDHIVPLSKGGPHLLSNLQPAHVACNSRKGDRPWNSR